MNHFRAISFGLLLFAALAACTATRTGATRSNSELITEAEMMEVSATNAYDIIQQLRPRWLMVRGSRSINMGTQVLVYLDNSRMGGVESLRQISRDVIHEMRYLDGAQASAELPGIGSEHVAGAIVISTRPGR